MVNLFKNSNAVSMLICWVFWWVFFLFLHFTFFLHPACFRATERGGYISWLFSFRADLAVAHYSIKDLTTELAEGGSGSRIGFCFYFIRVLSCA